MNIIELLSRDFGIHVVKHLSIVDIIQLKRVCKSTNVLKMPLWRIAMLTKGKIGFDPAFLFNKGCIISGGFLLECLHGDCYESDADVISRTQSYWDESDDVSVAGLLQTFGFEKATNTVHSYPIGLHAEKYEREGVVVDNVVIECAKKSSAEIVNSFDLPFCRNYYDGKRLYIGDLTAVATRSYELSKSDITNAQVVEYFDKDSEVYHKYINLVQRIHKYSNRGYTIKYDVAIVEVLKASHPGVMIELPAY